MRILAVIPHYFDPSPPESPDGRFHGSTGRDPAPRVEALSACIAALHQNFDPSQSVIDIARLVTRPANAGTSAPVDVIVCTSGDSHLCDAVVATLGPGSFLRMPVEGDPRFLGFACREALREHVGMYDYFCYLEDDLIVRDPWLFAKLAWFNSFVGDGCLLQPNRYEVARSGIVRKAYVDGDLADHALAGLGDLPEGDPAIRGSYLGREVAFPRPRNPHSGCYFLNARQFASWAARADFLDRDTAFIGPLESAATLGILRAFAVYKPAIENASFLEIEHFGTGFIGQIRMPGEGELERRTRGDVRPAADGRE